MPRGRLTALFAADAMLNEPDVEAAADKRTMAAFVEHSIRGEGQLRKWHNIA
jgi:hypothetical protein